MKVLFLLKINNGYGYYTGPKSGLFNSANILAVQLKEHLGLQTKVVTCVDGNSIDKEVNIYKPDIVILEAIWVTPEKLREIARLYPDIQFIVRVHSEVSFLSNEGKALEWINEYITIHNTIVGFNSKATHDEFRKVYPFVLYLPNIYEDVISPKVRLLKFMGQRKSKHHKREINIGCFGAIRPLKNQLFQALAAIRYASIEGKFLNYHINATRIEQQGSAVLDNIRSLFSVTRHNLVEHAWLDRPDFLALVGKMDLGLQISFTESFNIIAADFIKQGIPIIVSPSVRWCPDFSKVSTIDSDEVVHKIKYTLSHHEDFAEGQLVSLAHYNKRAIDTWISFILFELFVKPTM